MTPYSDPYGTIALTGAQRPRGLPMRQPRPNRDGAPPTPPIMDLSQRLPARKVSGKRSSSPSPNRRKLDSQPGRMSLGNFAKLFAALDSKPAGPTAQLTSAGAPESKPASSTLPEQIPRRSSTKHSNGGHASRNTTSPSNSTTPTFGKPKDLSGHEVEPTVIVNGKALRLACRPSSKSPPPESDSASSQHPPAKRSSVKHGPKVADGHKSQTTLGSNLNQFAALADADAIPPLTPPTSEDDDETLYPPYDEDDEGSASSRKNSATSTCITTPRTGSVQKTAAFMLGSNLESLLSNSLSTNSSAKTRAPDADTHSTPTPKSKNTAKIAAKDTVLLSPSSQNGHLLFDRRSAAAKLASPLKRIFGQAPPASFMRRVDEKFLLYDRSLERDFPLQLNNGVYVFIDWSNFLIGCRETVRQHRGMGPLEKLDFWVNFDRVKYLIERRRPVKVRDLAGSRGDSRAANEQLDYIKTTGYHVMDPQRRRTASSSDTEDTVGRKAEQCVDELLQLQMLHTLYDTDEEVTGVLILASGDGQDAEFSAGGFLKMVGRALKAGWCVELYAFSCSISSVYLDLEAEWPRRLRVHLLDDIAEGLVEQE